MVARILTQVNNNRPRKSNWFDWQKFLFVLLLSIFEELSSLWAIVILVSFFVSDWPEFVFILLFFPRKNVPNGKLYGKLYDVIGTHVACVWPCSSVHSFRWHFGAKWRRSTNRWLTYRYIYWASICSNEEDWFNLNLIHFFSGSRSVVAGARPEVICLWAGKRMWRRHCSVANHLHAGTLCGLFNRMLLLHHSADSGK